MRVLLDANVLVSAQLNKTGPPAMVLGICASKAWPMFTSNRGMKEVEKALTIKLRWPKDVVEKALVAIRGEVEVLEPLPVLVWKGLSDPKDGHLFDAAVYAKADVLVTGDQVVLDYKAEGLILEVMNPRQFFERFI